MTSAIVQPKYKAHCPRVCLTVSRLRFTWTRLKLHHLRLSRLTRHSRSLCTEVAGRWTWGPHHPQRAASSNLRSDTSVKRGTVNFIGTRALATRQRHLERINEQRREHFGPPRPCASTFFTSAVPSVVGRLSNNCKSQFPAQPSEILGPRS